jgi:Alpha amylase, catalytic domain
MSRRRVSVFLLAAALAAAAASTPVGTAGAAPRGPFVGKRSLRAPVTDETFYFVMADRFENGDTANDTGGISGDRLQHGFDPTSKGFYQGGDLKGLLNRIDYIQGLGTTSIWLTPSFKNKAVQLEDGPSAGYHGYWVTDFTQIDPHLGTNDELRALVEAAHTRGMKVYFDIITNHTADVIGYEEGARTAYIPKDREPYRTASGQPFDDRDYAGTNSFPPLEPEVTFPYTPRSGLPPTATASGRSPCRRSRRWFTNRRGGFRDPMQHRGSHVTIQRSRPKPTRGCGCRPMSAVLPSMRSPSTPRSATVSGNPLAPTTPGRTGCSTMSVRSQTESR